MVNSKQVRWGGRRADKAGISSVELPGRFLLECARLLRAD